MPAWLVPIITLFARPVMSLVLTGVTAASASFVTWLVAKGLPIDSATSIGAALVGGITWLITTLAQSQGVTIPVINADTNNGVRVVSSDKAKDAGLEKVNAPIPK